MLPRISEAKLEQIQKLKTEIITKDNICPVGLLYETDMDKVLEYPILYSVEYYRTLREKTLEIIPNSMVIITNFVGGEPCVYIEYSPISDYPVMDFKILKTKIKNEKLEKYGKRLFKFCENNNLNIINQIDLSIFNTQVQIF